MYTWTTSRKKLKETYTDLNGRYGESKKKKARVKQIGRNTNHRRTNRGPLFLSIIPTEEFTNKRI